MASKTLFVLALVVGSFFSCAAAASGDHGHDEEGDHGNSEAGDHGEEEGRPGLVYTRYTNQTELFVEFPALVAGETSAFAAHLTRLSDYRPLTSGQLDVILLKDDRIEARFRVDRPTRTGIFIPQVQPRKAGQFDLVLIVEDGDLMDRHELGPVQVFTSEADVRVTQPEGEGDIGYLKEQQWNNPFSTQTAKVVPLRPSAPAFGTVMAPADGSAEVAAPADGYLAAEALAGLGQQVSAGDVIAYLIPRLGGESDIGSLRVDLQRARSSLTLAEQEQQRVRELAASGAIAERRVAEAKEAVDIARSELTAATARVEQAQSTAAASGIALKAPVSGQIIETTVRPGAYVLAGTELFHIAPPGRRWLEMKVPEAYAEGIARSSGAWVGINGATRVLDQAVGARVIRAGGAIDPATRTAPVVIEYTTDVGPGLVGARYPGGVYTGEARSRLAIPRSAIVDDGGRTVVYVQTGGEMFVRRTVELGITDGPWVEVQRGINEGDRIVNHGAYYVKLASAGGEDIGHGHAH